MEKKLIVCSESLYTPIVSLIEHEDSMVVKSFNQSFLTQIQNRKTNIVNLADLIDQFMQYEEVYIIADSLNEGFELTLFFSEIRTRMIIVVTHNSRYIPIYKILGAKIVMITKPGEDSYRWLHRVV
ncbi:hypothetical protein [Brevibacillus sp. AY1]|uniref:hypothetical protein n=1 Tax=Brevibacillus sp. AY1 TaxID=2807621 RepID=UPI0024577256|nr:hypothetical protein [Brevibacillus sp. AY1]MDH4619905.1 hypothetical protein [Brevibacillus sp. AY1]